MPISLIAIIAVILGLGIYMTLTANKPKRAKDAKKQVIYTKAYKFLSSFFLTRPRISKIYNRLSIMSIYNKYDIVVISAKYYLMSLVISLSIIGTSIFLFKDALSVLICMSFAVLVSNTLIDKQLDKTNYQVYKSLRKAISAIREEYLRLGSVSESIESATYDPIIQRPMAELHNILVNSNGELRLHEFYESTPFRPLQTLAGICYNINNYGDNKDEYGHSNFIQALTLMSSDINSEVQRMAIQKARFGSIEYLPFVPILFIPVVETYFVSIMPGTALVYKGPLGYMCKTVTLVICLLAYSIISRINSVVAFKENDRGEWTESLLNKRFWDNFITSIVPKSRKAQKKEKMLKESLSKMELKHLYTKKVIYSTLALVMAIIATISTISMGKEFIRTSTQQLSLVANKEMDNYEITAIRALDQKFLSTDKEWREEEIKSLVKSYMPGLSDLQVLDQVNRLIDKKESLENAYFHWWYLLICYAIAILGWFGPEIMLFIRSYLVQTEAEDDFLQLQTLISILMNTNIDTLDALHELCQHSRIHKDMLLYCYHSYPANPEKELTRLQSKTPILEFKRFVSKLKLTISELSLREAFSDLIIEREHTVRMREIAMKVALDKKRTLAGRLAMLPIASFIIGSLMIPLLVVGFNEFVSAINGL